MMHKLDILAFGAHPDDVELGCGGTLLGAVAEGKKVGVIDLTKGELGTRGTTAQRLKEAQLASELCKRGVLTRTKVKGKIHYVADESHAIWRL